MKPEALDRLIIDETLGELPADAGELLRAYVALDASASARRLELSETARLARAALAPQEHELEAARAGLPPIDAKRPARRPGGRYWRMAGQLTGIAAVLLLGVLLGRNSESSEKPQALVVATRVTGAGVIAPNEAGGPDLWSAAQLYRRAHQGDERPQRTQVYWHSAISQPTFGGES
jgi:hypothetical protein